MVECRVAVWTEGSVPGNRVLCVFSIISVDFLLSCLLVALVLGFDWGKYLQEHGFKAAPVSCFKHVSSLLCLAACMGHVVCMGLPCAPVTSGGERPGELVQGRKLGLLIAQNGSPIEGPGVLGEEAEGDLVEALLVVIAHCWLGTAPGCSLFG